MNTHLKRCAPWAILYLIALAGCHYAPLEQAAREHRDEIPFSLAPAWTVRDDDSFTHSRNLDKIFANEIVQNWEQEGRDAIEDPNRFPDGTTPVEIYFIRLALAGNRTGAAEYLRTLESSNAGATK